MAGLISVVTAFGGAVYTFAEPRETLIVRTAFFVAGAAAVGLAICALYYEARARDLSDAEAEARAELAKSQAEIRQLTATQSIGSRLAALESHVASAAAALDKRRPRRFWFF